MEKIYEVDVATGEVEIRDLTPEEQEQRLAEQAANKAAKEAQLVAKEEAKAKREALLDRLGITEEEAKLLLS